jgi:hypothetical protein
MPQYVIVQISSDGDTGSCGAEKDVTKHPG